MTPAGRPEIGQPVHIRLGDDLIAEVDAKAASRGMSRAEIIRTTLTEHAELLAEVDRLRAVADTLDTLINSDDVTSGERIGLTTARNLIRGLN